MPIAPDVRIRLAQASDAPHIAKLHADSWQRHYRGAYSDRYLDGDLFADRLAAWTERMARHDRDDFTVLAEHHDRPVGFAHVVVDADPIWGALVDNLHVARPVQRSGIGALLLDRVARILIERRPASSLYLWVLEPNKDAQAFYLSRRGRFCGDELAAPPRGDPRNLAGSPRKIRVAWSDPASLVLSDRP